MVLIGLAQKFMEKNLAVDFTGHARGVVLEIKKIEGLGIVLDTIIYAGILRQGDTILIGGVDKIIKTKAKILQVPAALCEIRDKKTKFVNAEEVLSAAAVRICAPDIEDAIAGMPIISIKDQDIKEAEEDLKKQIEEVMLDTDGDGIVIKADSLGSLEALIKMLREKNIRIKKASIGEITKKDLIDAKTNVETENFTSVILGFNSAPNKEVEEMQKSSNVKIITSDIIYALIEQFERWKEETLKEMQEKELIKLVQPAKLILLSGYVFRQSNPAIVGVEILEGKLLTGTHLMKDDGNQITTVKAMQEEKNSINEAEAGKKIALSLEHVIVGRQIFEGDVFFSVIPESDFRKFKELKHLLGNKEKELLRVIADINRKKDPFWGA
jgi:translation initiation factor 5B